MTQAELDRFYYNSAIQSLLDRECDKVRDVSLKTQCKNIIFESLGKCEMLSDATEKQTCLNVRAKNSAVKSISISKCASIKNDTNLFNLCISEVNDLLFIDALMQDDINICKGIYNSSLQEKCVEEVNAS